MNLDENLKYPKNIFNLKIKFILSIPLGYTNNF